MNNSYPAISLLQRALALSVAFTPVLATAQTESVTPTIQQNYDPSSVEELAELQSRVQATIKHVLPSIVAVGNQFGDPVEPSDRRCASGVIIGEDGLVLSQYHVSHIGNLDTETGLIAYGKPGDLIDIILSDGRQVDGRLLGGNRQVDISLIQIQAEGPFPVLRLAENDSAKLGQWVVKLGHPLGYNEHRGVSSRLGKVTYANSLNIVTDCSISGGDSGGPIVNLNGQILGLIQNSYLPNSINPTDAGGSSNMAMSFMTTNKISEHLESMLAAEIPEPDWKLEENERRKTEYEKVKAVLSTDRRRDGKASLQTWQPIAATLRGSVVEILKENRRVCLGTVVGHDGQVLTKASVIPDYPRVRLPSGDVVEAKVMRIDQSLDIAVLNVDSSQLSSIPVVPGKVIKVGQLVTTANLDGDAIAMGIVGSPIYQGDSSRLKPRITAQQAIEGDPQIVEALVHVFEHDMVLSDDELGGPIVDLNGQILGITIAHTGDHGCIGIPLSEIFARRGEL